MKNKKIGSALAVFEANIDKNRAYQEKPLTGNLVSAPHKKALPTTCKTDRRLSDDTLETQTDQTSLGDCGTDHGTDHEPTLKQEVGESQKTTTDAAIKQIAPSTSAATSERTLDSKPKAAGGILKASKFTKSQPANDGLDQNNSKHASQPITDYGYDEEDYIEVRRIPAEERAERRIPRRSSRRSLSSRSSRRNSCRSLASSLNASTASVETFGSFMGDSVDTCTLCSFDTNDSFKLGEEKKKPKKKREPSQGAPVNSIAAQMDQHMHLLTIKRSSEEDYDVGDDSLGSIESSFTYEDDEEYDFESDRETET